MKENFYDRQNYDYEIVRGDTCNILLTFYDKSGNAVDITGYTAAKFTVEDPITETQIFQLTRNAGVYLNGDGAMPAGGAAAINQALIVISSTNSDLMNEEGVYAYDLEFTIGTSTLTPVTGTLIIKKEIT